MNKEYLILLVACTIFLGAPVFVDLFIYIIKDIKERREQNDKWKLHIHVKTKRGLRNK